jgi:hypothetical protein
VVLRLFFIPRDLAVVVPALWQIASEECFDSLLYRFGIVELKQHHEVNIRPARRIQHAKILAAYDA